jgi:formamidopyrimidine-DNA glycosylase
MPELPDVEVYVESIAARVVGQPLEAVRFASPFVLRTAVPPIKDAFGQRVVGVRRVGKRIVLELECELFIVIHLMIAGRFRWLDAKAAIPKKIGLAALDFPNGTLALTEASTKKRASIHVVPNEAALVAMDPGGIDPIGSSLAHFRKALTVENHTLKRSLTDPHLFSGIGNAYSDEILHRAKLSPTRHTTKLTDDEIERLRDATRDTLVEWTVRLRKEAGENFPEKVTAFRKEMAVHGKYNEPCPACGAPVQRIVYAANEANYCPTCQTEGKLLADRGLSRLLGRDWPRSLEELEAMKTSRKE